MMAALGRDNLHSRLVIWLKILLPLAALAILSTLFLVSSRGIIPEDAIPYAEAEIADRLREPRLTDASFAGMTKDGAALTLKAAMARPGVTGTADSGLARGLSGVLETPDGQRTELAAAEARLDEAARLMILSGGVKLTTSTGYQIETAGLTVALDHTGLDSTGLDSTGQVTATGPGGTITAGRLHLGQASAGLPGYQLVFNGGVRLLYQPPKQGN